MILLHFGWVDRGSINRLKQWAGRSIAGSKGFYGAKPIVFRRSFRTAPVLPESIGERGDAVLFSFVRNSVRALPGPRTLVFLLSNQIGLVGMLMALAGGFVSGQVIFFAVVLGAGSVGVRSQVTTFGRYLL